MKAEHKESLQKRDSADLALYLQKPVSRANLLQSVMLVAWHWGSSARGGWMLCR